MSVVADGLGTRSDSRTSTEQLVRIGVPYLHYVRQDHSIEDARGSPSRSRRGPVSSWPN
ncbi:hypothetical protein AB0M86_36050 [Streptomyces sp. NPDC051639]|uniref:hypothetical protein n=1 Tax=Streptomyces sp. NPDC051639 TaxID=3155671 RepID=UPI0034238F25